MRRDKTIDIWIPLNLKITLFFSTPKKHIFGEKWIFKDKFSMVPFANNLIH